LLRDEAADAGADQRRVARQHGGGHDPRRRVLQLPQLRLADGACQAAPRLLWRRRRITPDHAREPCGAFRHGLAAPVRGGVLIGMFRQLARESIDIGHGGEIFGHHAAARAVDLDMLHHRHDGRAHRAAIDELVAGQARRVVATLRGDRTAAARHDVRGGAADIDEQAAAEPSRQKPRAGVPIGRSDARGMVGGALRGMKNAVAGINGDGREIDALRHRAEDGAHALRAVGKDVGKLAGHGHGMAMGHRPAGEPIRDRRREAVDALP